MPKKINQQEGVKVPENKGLLTEIAKCGLCGGEMSLNPHPEAGKPPIYLEVGTKYVCIPCTVESRHNWANRAMEVEGKLAKIREVVEGAGLTDEQMLEAWEKPLELVTGSHQEEIAKAQLQAILKAIDKEDK